MKIAVASGKGGTGKTFVATNLSAVLADMNEPVTLVDCDVEEPNAHLFVHPEIMEQTPITVDIPVIDHDRCTGCRMCAEHCEFRALITVKQKTFVFEDMCHACGFCMRICPEQAIRRRAKTIGKLSVGQFGRARFLEGELMVGTELVTPVIARVREAMPSGGMVVLDAPPGTSCPVVEAVRGMDFVVLVTEPTPFGLNDLALAVDLCRAVDVPCGVVENRAMDGNDSVVRFCEDHGVPLLATIPLDRAIAECYSHGNLVVDQIPAYRSRFVTLAASIRERVLP